MLWGYVCGGWMMAKSAAIAVTKASDPFYATKLVTARFYAEHVLPKTSALAHEVQHGGATTMAFTEDQFDLDRKSLALA
jgi:acyl-CoA dehydrogenase